MTTSAITTDTTDATASTTARAEAFAAQVRAHLDDLPSSDLDELLDGLNADLAERLAEGGELGDAQQYAEELRQAAGLPERTADATAPSRPSLGERLSAIRPAISAWFDETAGRRGARDFATSLLPLWWVLRATIGTWAVLLLMNYQSFGQFGRPSLTLALWIAAVVLSVQWGRGKWLPQNWLRHMRTVANVLAVLLLLPFLGNVGAILNAGSPTEPYVPPVQGGITLDGAPVTNVFAYDCEGNLLDGIRLYDQAGRPIVTTKDFEGDETPGLFWDETAGETLQARLNPLAADADAWNVYPLWQSVFVDFNAKPTRAEQPTPTKRELPPLTRDCAAQPESGAQAESGAQPESGTQPGSTAKPGTDAKP